jgi:hypothetical protein
MVGPFLAGRSIARLPRRPRIIDPCPTEDGVTFFEWLAAVCRELGWGVMRAHDMLDDTRWSDMFGRGLSPAQAAEQARRDGLA